MDQQIVIALISFVAGIVVSLIGIFGKYLFDYRIARRKLQIEERDSVSNILGSSLPNLIRSARDLYTRISNFFENPEKARDWLKPATSPEKDGYYLHEFVRRLFNFIAWGRVTQDSINSLPSAVIQERPDIKRTYLFVDLAYSLLTYTWLFRGIENYDDEYQRLHLFTGSLDAIAEDGVRLWKDGDHTISRQAFEKLYHNNSSVIALRKFLTQVCDKNDAAGFIIARLAALRAVLAGFLADYSWTIAIPKQKQIIQELQQHLHYAATSSNENRPFTELVPRNLQELMNRYQIKLLRVP